MPLTEEQNQKIFDKVSDAMKANNMDVFVEVINNKDFDVNYEDQDKGVNLLMYSIVEKCDSKYTNFLIDHEATNLNTKGTDGCSALMLASLINNMQIIEKLIEKGANINIQTKQGLTALSTATRFRNAEAVQALCDLGADVNIQDQEGKSALHMITSSYGFPQLANLKTVKTLLDHKADPNLQDNYGKTPLHYADSVGFIDLLFNKKVEGALHPDVKNNEGQTAAEYLRVNGRPALADRIEERKSQESLLAIRSAQEVTRVGGNSALKRFSRELTRKLGGFIVKDPNAVVLDGQGQNHGHGGQQQ